MLFKRVLAIILGVMLLVQAGVHGQERIKIACVGTSITYGAGLKDREHTSYPAQLEKMLGDGYHVLNFGVSGATLLRKGDHPYMKTAIFHQVQVANPDVIVIDMGTNDSKSFNRIYLNEFKSDYHALIDSFQRLPAHPRIILMTAMTSFVTDTNGIWDPVIIKQINPRIQEVAFDNQVEVIDMHSPFVNQIALVPDKIHPDSAGANVIARNIYRLLSQARDRKFDVLSKLKPGFNISNYYGYTCASFTFNGRSCKIVVPKLAAMGHPWIWRARFWGHEPQTEIALLQQGFNVVYCDAAELLGNKESVALWNEFYKLITNAGLAKKGVLEGMSRGAVYNFNWAAENPDKVAAVYVDNPLLNIPSWARDFPIDTTESMFVAFKKDYQLNTMQDIDAFKNSPIDKVKAIVKGHYPILILCADADEAVNPKENTLAFANQIKKFGGIITVIHKPGFKHHPHSLPNPAPIVDFILTATGYMADNK